MAQGQAYERLYNHKFLQRLEQDMEQFEMLYIHAPFGWGKKSVLRAFCQKHGEKEIFWLEDMPQLSLEQQIAKLPKSRKGIYIIPNMEKLVEEDREDLVCELLSRKKAGDIFLFASSAMLPAKLLPYTIANRYISYGIDDMKPEGEDVLAYMKGRGITLTAEELCRIEKDSDYLPLYVQLLANVMVNTKKGYTHSVREQSMEDLHLYIDAMFFRGFDREDQNAMLRLSCLDTFDNRLIAYMLDISRKEADDFVERMLLKSSVLQKTVDGWRFFPVMKNFLERAGQKYLDEQERQGDYYRAMQCLEEHENWFGALRFSYILHDKDSTAKYLDQLLKQNVDYSVFLTLEIYFQDLSDDVLMQYPNLIIAGAILRALTGDVASIRRYEKSYQKLLALETDPARRKKMQENMLTAYSSNPGMTRRNVLEICAGLLEEIVDNENEEETFRAAPHYVSVLRGEKDFCKYFTADAENTDTIRRLHKAAEKLSDRTFALMLDYMEIEVLYDRNDLDRALEGLVKISRQAKICGSRGIQQLCTMGMADLLAARNQMNGLETMKIDSLQPDVRGMSLFDANCQAHLIYYYLLKNQETPILQWMNGAAPDETEFFYTIQYYQYLVKAKVYIWMKQNVRAISILQLLLDYAQEYGMTYLEAQVRILKAMIYEQENNPRWKELFLPALEWGRSLGFIRIFADEGAAVYKLLSRISQEEKDWEKDEYLKKVCAAAKLQMLQYPNYLNRDKKGGNENFSESELAVMQLLVLGHKNAEIAAKLYVSENTVKYHLKNIYQKLQVTSRSQAIHRIREEKII